MPMTKVYCPKCHRYLFETDSTAIVSNLKCGGCKAHINIKIVTNSSTQQQLRYKFAEKGNINDLRK